MREVTSIQEAVQVLGGEERVVRFVNAEIRGRIKRAELNKSWRLQAKKDAQEFRTLTQAAERKGVSLTDLLNEL